jgi:pimeloyl-ACP methyl ester carboxylesterase
MRSLCVPFGPLAATMASISLASACAAGPQPAAAQGEAESVPSLLERARAVLNDPSRLNDAADAASKWVKANLNPAQARALLAEIETGAKQKLDDAVAEARERHTREMGVRLFNGKSLSLGNEAWDTLAPASAAATPLPSRMVLLIHGLDEPGDIWNDLVPSLRTAKFDVARFDYPNDGPIAESAGRLTGWLRALRARGVMQVDLVCHSMGGLVARDALTRPGLYGGTATGHDDLPDVPRLIMVGTPNKGSAWAHVECLAECRDQFQRLLDSGKDADAGNLVGWLVDGRGEAADDLLPNSAFLNELNARPMPVGVRMTSIVGRAVTPESVGVDELLSSRFVRALLSAEEIDRVRASIASASESLGDGPVGTASATLGAGETVRIDAAHNSMLRRLTLPNMALSAIKGEAPAEPPPAIPVVLEALQK